MFLKSDSSSSLSSGNCSTAKYDTPVYQQAQLVLQYNKKIHKVTPAEKRPLNELIAEAKKGGIACVDFERSLEEDDWELRFDQYFLAIQEMSEAVFEKLFLPFPMASSMPKDTSIPEAAQQELIQGIIRVTSLDSSQCIIYTMFSQGKYTIEVDCTTDYKKIALDRLTNLNNKLKLNVSIKSSEHFWSNCIRVTLNAKQVATLCQLEPTAWSALALFNQTPLSPPQPSSSAISPSL